MLTRTQFLTKNWSPYPKAVRSKSSRMGRLVFLKEPNELYFQNQAEVFRVSFPVKIEEFTMGSFSELSQILIPGDWIVADEDRLQLLAPNLAQALETSTDLRTLQLWTQFEAEVRNFFVDRGFLSVQTPNLVKNPGTEPSLDPIRVHIKTRNGVEQRYLPTSPEISLKKTLSMGFEKIFEIKSVYRDAELSEVHQIEFLMLEWYRSFEDLQSIKKDLQDLLNTLVKKFDLKQNLEIQSISMAQLWQKYLKFELHPETTFEQLLQLTQKLGISVSKEDSWDDLFHRLFIEKIEPQLKNESSVFFLEKYPPSQAALARLTEDGWGDRFELYIHGVEIANAFCELNDPSVQRQRSKQDQVEKRRLGKEVQDLDEEFFQALDSGMPPAAGIALGLERLFMVLFGYQELKQIRVFTEKIR